MTESRTHPILDKLDEDEELSVRRISPGPIHPAGSVLADTRTDCDDTDELPRVSIQPDGSATFSGDLDDSFPQPDAELPPLSASDIPF